MNNNQYSQKALEEHKKLAGKIQTIGRADLTKAEQLSTYYTPGVGAVSSYLAKHPEQVKDYTIAGNTVAVVSDGSAVLGLGNVGPEAALPVMEGKAMLFSQLGGMNAFPIVLRSQDTQEIINTIVNIAPVFAAINLEDIAAPACFAIEKALQARLTIPVVHDDQHATAIVVLAGLINALTVVNKQADKIKVVILGAGAAGNAVAKLLVAYGVGEIITVDSRGIIYKGREGLDEYKSELADITNKTAIRGLAEDAVTDADVIIGLTTGGTISPNYIKMMNTQPIVFALANPIPEIMPVNALQAGAAVVATGRSDFANQINNVLVFPGLFKGLIESRQMVVSEAIKITAATALAKCVKNPAPDNIVPSVFDERVVPAITEALTAKHKHST